MDIKPQNMMYNMDTKQLVFIDFGISCTQSKKPCLTKYWSLNYVDPTILIEFENKKEHFYHSANLSDVYSLGMTMYHLITKNYPLPPETEMEFLMENYDIYKSQLKTHYNEYGQIIDLVIDMINPNINERSNIVLKNRIWE